MFLTAPEFAIPEVSHGFFTRHGGVSDGLFSSLNCGLSNADNPACVSENRVRASRALGFSGDHLTSLYQVHGTEVVTVNAPVPAQERPRADALVSRTPGVLLGILTADCAPILFYDPAHQVIGAAHSGWKGTLLNIGAATMDAMEQLGARRADTIAVIGPCIARQSYEVGPDFPVPFKSALPEADRFFTPSQKAGHFMFDLAGCIAHRLEQAGIGQINALAQDTCRNEDFFSNRRAFHRGEPGFGLQLSAIALMK